MNKSYSRSCDEYRIQEKKYVYLMKKITLHQLIFKAIIKMYIHASGLLASSIHLLKEVILKNWLNERQCYVDLKRDSFMYM